MDSTPQWVHEPEAAKLLAIKHGTLRSMRRDGRLTPGDHFIFATGTEDVVTSEAIENVDDTNNQIEDIDHHDDDHSDTSRPTDVDGDGAFQPLRDGLLISSAGQAIEIAAGTESQPGFYNRNLHDQLINPNGSRNTTDAAKGFIKDAITSGSLDRNNNNVLDLQDAQRILRDGLGTYPGDAATAGLREPPVPAGTTNSDLINEQQQLDALDDSLEAIALMADAGPQFLARSRNVGS